MAGKRRTIKDFPTVFKVIEIDKDKFVLLGAFNKKQLDTFMDGLQKDYENRASGKHHWVGQYQALAKAIVQAYKTRE